MILGKLLRVDIYFSVCICDRVNNFFFRFGEEYLVNIR